MRWAPCSCFPMDTLKIRLQTFPERYLHTGMRGVVQDMTRNGVGALYRGLPSPLSGMGLLYAVTFAANGQATRALQQRNVDNGHSAQLSLWQMTMAGGYAGFVQAPLRTVIERVKVAMQAREGKGGAAPYRWSGACAVALIREEGLRNGLFRGLSATFWREIP